MQPVIQAAQAQATNSTSNPGPENKKLFLLESEAQATSYTGTQAQATSHTHRQAQPPVRRAIQPSTLIQAAQ